MCPTGCESIWLLEIELEIEGIPLACRVLPDLNIRAAFLWLLDPGAPPVIKD